jgi:prolipoprotein diacylglyceryltransferase
LFLHAINAPWPSIGPLPAIFLPIRILKRLAELISTLGKFEIIFELITRLTQEGKGHLTAMYLIGSSLLRYAIQSLNIKEMADWKAMEDGGSVYARPPARN